MRLVEDRKCQATTRAGSRCTRGAARGEEFCRQHLRTHRRDTHGSTVPRPNHAAVEAKQRRALELVMAGHNYADVARRVGYSDRSGARKAVSAALDQMPRVSDFAEWRAIHNARYERLFSAVWTAATAARDADHSDHSLKAVKEARQILGSQARLLGLDAPVRANVSVEVEPATSQLPMAERRKLVERMLAERREKLIQVGFQPVTTLTPAGIEGSAVESDTNT